MGKLSIVVLVRDLEDLVAFLTIISGMALLRSWIRAITWRSVTSES